MPIGYWALLLPAVQLGAASWLVYRIHWRRYRTLVPSILIGAIVDLAYVLAPLHCRKLIWQVSLWVILPMRVAVALEVCKISCLSLSRREKMLAYLTACGISLLSFVVTRICLKAPAWGSLLISRQYLLICIAVALCWLWLYRRWHPAMENDEHFAYRSGFTVLAVRWALSATAVRGGLLDLVLRGGLRFHTWKVIDVASWIAEMVIYLVTAWWMARGYSSRVPEWCREASA